MIMLFIILFLFCLHLDSGYKQPISGIPVLDSGCKQSIGNHFQLPTKKFNKKVEKKAFWFPYL